MYEHLGKLRFYCQKVLPLVYDNSLSYYELLCKVVKKLNECIERQNTLDEYVTQYLQNTLQEWLQNGVIADIINQTIFNDLNVDIQQLKQLTQQHSLSIEDILTRLGVTENEIININANIKSLEDNISDIEIDIDGLEKEIELLKQQGGLNPQPIWKSVVDFGADPTGAKDSTPAFNKAFESNVHYLYVPEGQYILNTKPLFEDTRCIIYKNSDASITGAGASYIGDLTAKGLIIGGMTGRAYTRDLGTMVVQRVASYYEGESVNNALRAVTDVTNEYAKGYEWAFLGQVNNNSSSDTGSQNVGVYAQGNCLNNGHTWGMVAEVQQKKRTANPNHALVALEVDVNADETDENYNRVGIDIYMREASATTESQRQWGHGLRITAQNGVLFHGIQLKGSIVTGIDFEKGNFIGNAMQFGNRQQLSFAGLKLYGAEGTALCVGYGDTEDENRVADFTQSAFNLRKNLYHTVNAVEKMRTNADLTKIINNTVTINNANETNVIAVSNDRINLLASQGSRIELIDHARMYKLSEGASGFDDTTAGSVVCRENGVVLNKRIIVTGETTGEAHNDVSGFIKIYVDSQVRYLPYYV